MSRTLWGIGEFHFVMRPLRTSNDYRNAPVHFGKTRSLDGIGFEEAIQNPIAQKKNLSTLFRKGHAV